MRATTLQKATDHEEGIWALAWVPDTDSLVTGSVDETVKLWRIGPEAECRVLHTYTGQTLGVIAVTAEPSGPYAASSALDSTIRVWNISTHQLRAIIETPPSETWEIQFGPVTEHSVTIAAAGGSTGRIAIHKAESSEEPASVTTMEMPQAARAGGDNKQRKGPFVLSVAYSPDGTRLVAGAMDGSIAMFDVETTKLLHSLKGHDKAVRSVAFTPDSKLLLTGCDDMHANLYDSSQGALVESFSGHESWVLDVAVHPNGATFATSSSDAKVKLWDLNTRTCSQTMTEHTDQVWAIAFNTDGTRLASVSEDRQLVLYSVA